MLKDEEETVFFFLIKNQYKFWNRFASYIERQCTIVNYTYKIGIHWLIFILINFYYESEVNIIDLYHWFEFIRMCHVWMCVRNYRIQWWWIFEENYRKDERKLIE